MKYTKYLLFLLIIFLVPNVYASDYKLNSHISATSGGTKNRYGGLENYNYGSYGTYTFGTRYQGRLGNIETYIDYPFEANTTYTLTYNMNTEDFINHFGSSYWWDCSQTMTNSNATVQSVNYISYKKIKFTFTPTANTTCIFVSIRSTNPNSTSITQITNWQLDSIYLYDPDYQGSGGSGGSGGTPTPTPDPNQDIIDNANQNTSDIIDNNNENTQSIIDSQQELLGNCSLNYFDINSDKNAWNTTYTTTNSNLNVTTSSGFVAFKINNPSDILGSKVKIDYKFLSNTGFNRVAMFFASSDITDGRDYVSITNNNNYFDIPSSFPSGTNNILVAFYGNNYSLTDIALWKNGSYPYVSYNTKSCTSKIDNTTDAINDLNNSINNDNIDNGVGSDFFEDFTENTHGLSGIITIPLQAIQNLASNQCQTLTIPLPFTDSSITLPCMTEYYQEHIPTLYALLQTIIYGFMAYRILIDIFAMVKGFKDPDNDKIEVLDL